MNEGFSTFPFLFIIKFISSRSLNGFLDHLMKGLEKHKRSVLVLIEEVNRYCPLSTRNHPDGAAPWVLGRIIGKIIELQRDSRKLGVVPVLAKQRP